MNAATATILVWARKVRRSPAGRRFLLVILVVLGGWLGWRALTTESLPDFSGYENTQEKKDAFFGYLLPLIQEVNGDVMKDRERLLKISEQLSDSDSAGFLDDRFLKRMAEEYDFEDIPDQVDEVFANMVLQRVDIIAPSLVLAQAANESGWGSSRFARHGNNLFGMHTNDGSGMVPKRRKRGHTFTVAVYPTPRASIEAYVHNLNTQNSYRQLRRVRASLRSRNATISGYALANGLMSYSERGSAYISELQSMIGSNNLSQYDTE